MSSSRSRSGSARAAMFLKLLWRSSVRRKGRGLTALLAITGAAAVTTAILTLYLDSQSRLHNEFRRYGANIIVTALNEKGLPPNTLEIINQTLGDRARAIPFSYAIAQSADGRPIVVAGSDFAALKSIDGWWSVDRWPTGDGALVGERAAAEFAPAMQPFALRFKGASIEIKPEGKVSTGAQEDSRIFLPLGVFAAWTGLPVSNIEVADSGSVEQIRADIARLSAALPDAEVKPVLRIVEGETTVLTKTRSTLYLAAAAIVLTAALCVFATLIGWVFDRKADFAIMKALGGSESVIAGFFAAEVALIGAAGSVIGFAAGAAIASLIGRLNFHSSILPQMSLFPPVLAGCLALTLLAALVPISLLRQVQPAIILRGE